MRKQDIKPGVAASVNAGCPSPAQPDAELARLLFDSVTFRPGERLPVNGGTWLRESYGSGTVACEQCGRLAADSIDFMPMAQTARDHAAETGHEVVVQGSRSALYGPPADAATQSGDTGEQDR